MFGLFRPRCPVDAREKAWTETRMKWLADNLGIDRMLEATVILPTEEFFPDPYDGTEPSARVLFDRVCEYMKVDSKHIELQFYDDLEHPDTAGWYEETESGATVHIAASGLRNQYALIAMMVHELAHDVLLDIGEHVSREDDYEFVVDLVAPFLGIGIFGANTVICEMFDSTLGWHRWSIGRKGYLTARIYGYAFALFCRHRHEPDPVWKSHLRHDASEVVTESLKYLKRTGDSLFDPDGTVGDLTRASLDDLCEFLKTGTAGTRIGVLWEISERESIGDEVVHSVIAEIRDQDPIVRAQVATVIAVLGHAPRSSIEELVFALDDESDRVRAEICTALGVLATNHELVVPALMQQLSIGRKSVIRPAAEAIAEFGPIAAEAAPIMLDRLIDALVACDFGQTEALSRALLRVVPDPESLLVERYAEQDPDLLRQAREAIHEASQPAEDDGSAASATGSEGID